MKTRLAVMFAGAVVATALVPLPAQAANGVCLGRKVTLTGTLTADDPFDGTPGNDVMASLDGNDVAAGDAGDDRMCGGPGNDVVHGDAGNDVIRGNEGDDVLLGGDGTDGYNGGPGTDICDVQTGDRSFGGCEASLADDTDTDGLTNGAEIDLGTSAFTTDTDGDGASDGEEIEGETDPLVPNEWPGDRDRDSVLDGADNCADRANRDQADLDRDRIGDVCDGDADGDLIADSADNCPRLENDQADFDGDGLGDACDPDDDDDRVLDGDDRCPLVLGYEGCPPLGPPAPPVDPGPPPGDDDRPPTFMEFYLDLVDFFGIACPLGRATCEDLTLDAYEDVFGTPPPAYTLPDAFPCMGDLLCLLVEAIGACPICGCPICGGIGGIGIGIGGFDPGGCGVPIVCGLARQPSPSRRAARSLWSP